MGISYTAPTPVGNMEDMTMRATHTLKEVGLVPAEDTRASGRLLKHYDIQNHLLSHHKLNEYGTSAGIVERSKVGQSIVLISGTGIPGIGDPGFFLAREVAKVGITVRTPPGTAACIPAVASSGLPCDHFCLEGFLPQKKDRQTQLEALKEECRTMVFYESPYRLLKILQQFADVFSPDRLVNVAREVSEPHEEYVRDTPEEAIRHFKEVPPRGEIVIVVGGDNKNKKLKTERIRKRL